MRRKRWAGMVADKIINAGFVKLRHIRHVISTKSNEGIIKHRGITPEWTTDPNKCQPNNVRQTINASGNWGTGQGRREWARGIEGDRSGARFAHMHEGGSHIAHSFGLNREMATTMCWVNLPLAYPKPRLQRATVLEKRFERSYKDTPFYFGCKRWDLTHKRKRLRAF
jgi:hypothetical protein